MNPGAPTDYFAHDRVYRRLRAGGGRSGWNTPEELEFELRLLDDMMRWDGVPAAGPVLEIGCGAGEFALHLAALGCRVHGVDISPTAVAWAREHAAARGLAATFEVGDVCTLDGCATDSFDLVLDGHCLHCIIGADRALCLAAVRRVLRPGGSFLVRTMCGPVAQETASAIGFDAASGLVFRRGVATRYIGLPQDIRRDLVEGGFVEAAHAVVPARDAGDLDQLLVHVRSPG